MVDWCGLSEEDKATKHLAEWKFWVKQLQAANADGIRFRIIWKMPSCVDITYNCSTTREFQVITISASEWLESDVLWGWNRRVQVPTARQDATPHRLSRKERKLMSYSV